MFLLSGCPASVPWNPLYQGAELDRELTFNIEDIGIKITSLAFYCGTGQPLANIRIKNFSPDSLYFDFSRCTVLVEDKTYAAVPVEYAQVILPPGKSAQRKISFFTHLEQYEGQNEYIWKLRIPTDVTVKLDLGEVTFSDRIVELPSVDYRYPYKEHHGTKFP
jgi:hypothetical protein